MTVEPRNIINSPFGLSLAYLLGRFTPNWLGYKIAYTIADFISAHKTWKMVQAVRANQWMANQGQLDKASLDRAVVENFRSIAISVYDLYHNLNNSAAFLRILEPNSVAIELVQRPEFSKRGLIIAGVHTSNFDMVFQSGGLAGVQAIALTLPELSPAYRKQFEMRLSRGMKVVPASVGTIKNAVGYLKSGGLVITGLDRPDENYIYRPKFFGRPACVPIHHIFLAIKAHVPVMVAAVSKEPDEKYHLTFSEPIEMQPYPDRHQEIVNNAEAVLKVAESYILRDPSQWSMTFPVWPELVGHVPV